MKMPRVSFQLALLVVIGLAPLLVLAAPQAPPPEIVRQNSELFSWVIGLMALGLIGLIGMKISSDAQTQKNNHENNKEQWAAIKENRDDLQNVRVDVAGLRGEHNINHPIEFKR